jgi:hypothetical protein
MLYTGWPFPFSSPSITEITELGGKRDIVDADTIRFLRVHKYLFINLYSPLTLRIAVFLLAGDGATLTPGTVLIIDE